MENKKALIISLICFLASMILITGYVRVKRYEMTAEFGDEVRVVVAAKEIPEYATITEQMLSVVTVFKSFRQPQTVEDIGDIVGKSAYVSISKGEQVTLTKLVHQDGRPVLDKQVERSMRAVTINISPHSGVGRLVRPGNRVDVMATTSYDQGGQTLFEIKTVIQNAMVLATGRTIQNEVPTRVNRDVLNYIQAEFEEKRRKDYHGSLDTASRSRLDDNYTHITLQLSPADAEKILYLSHVYGDRSLYLALRNRADQKEEKLPTTILDDILGPESDYGILKRKPLPQPEPKKPRFEDLKGNQVVPVE